MTTEWLLVGFHGFQSAAVKIIQRPHNPVEEHSARIDLFHRIITAEISYSMSIMFYYIPEILTQNSIGIKMRTLAFEWEII